MSVTPPASIEGWELLDLLTSLVQNSLVVYEEDGQGRGRHHLLATVRQYSRDRLLEDQEAIALRKCYAAFLLAQAEHEEAGPAVRSAGLEVEHDNLLAALACCREDPAGGERELRLAGALGMFWETRGEERDTRPAPA